MARVQGVFRGAEGRARVIRVDYANELENLVMVIYEERGTDRADILGVVESALDAVDRYKGTIGAQSNPEPNE